VRTISHYQCHSIGLYSPVIYSSIIFHIFPARFLSSLDLNPPSELPIIKLIKICSILMVEETGVPGGNQRYVIRAENPFYTVQLTASWDRTHTLH
jgi:hypothetical protein